MTAYVLVHGDRVWRPVADILQAAGHVAFAPSLTGYGERTHPTRPDLRLLDHATEITDLVVGEDLFDVVLVGHSYGGMVITVAAEQIADRLRHLVYVDALAPRDGESALDISPPGRSAEILELARTRGEGVWVPHRNAGPGAGPGHPLGTSVERVRRGNPAAAAFGAEKVTRVRRPVRTRGAARRGPAGSGSDRSGRGRRAVARVGAATGVCGCSP